MGSVDLVVSDQAELGSLREWLSWTPGLEISQVSGKPGEGEQGALDVLTVLAGSGGLIAAVRVLPEFLRAKRSSLTITTTVKGKQFKLNATNVDDVLPVLERLLDD